MVHEFHMPTGAYRKNIVLDYYIVNDHQVGIAKEFDRLQHLMVAHDADQLLKKINKLYDFKPKTRINQIEKVVSRVENLFKGV